MVGGKPLTGRQCILQQALVLFSLRGYKGASIRDIVRACGLSNAALYYHFRSKQHLYFEVIKECISAVVQKLQEAGSGGGTCRQRLTRVAHAYAQVIMESQSVIQTLFRDLAQFDPEDAQRLLPYVRRVPSMIAAIVEEGVAAGEVRPADPYRVSVALLGAINSLVFYRLDADSETTLEEDVALTIAMLYEGFGI